MKDKTFNQRIARSVDDEIIAAERCEASSDYGSAFKHLERAHVLGQSITFEHTRVHWRMLKIALKTKNWREVYGQIFRIAGASTKTPLGIYPTGNTGGADVYFFKPMPVPADLQAIIDGARTNLSN